MTDLERIKKDVVEMDGRANVCWYDTKVLTKAVRLILEELTADRKTENSSEIPNNCEPKICDTCRYYNSNIPCGSTPSACKEADKFAEEFVDGLKKLKPKVEPQTSPTISKMEQVDKPQTGVSYSDHTDYDEPKNYVTWTEPQTYITEDRDTQILDAWQVHHRNTTTVKDEPQTERSE